MSELEEERQHRKAEMEKATADLDTLADDLQKAKDAEQAAIKSGSEEAIRTAKEAEQKARARMGEKLWKVYGPQSWTRIAFQAWAEDYRLENASNVSFYFFQKKCLRPSADSFFVIFCGASDKNGKKQVS